MSKILDVFKAFGRAIKGEVQEIKELVITEEDKKQATYMQSIISAVLASYGIPTTPTTQKAIQTALSYLIRDLKDGQKTPSKLIIVRIVDELKSLKTPKD